MPSGRIRNTSGTFSLVLRFCVPQGPTEVTLQYIKGRATELSTRCAQVGSTVRAFHRLHVAGVNLMTDSRKKRARAVLQRRAPGFAFCFLRVQIQWDCLAD